MKEKVNPAKRVLKILKHGNELPSNLKIRTAWGRLLNVDPEDASKVLMALATFIQLVDKARIAVQELDKINKEIYMQPFGQIQKALGETNLEARWQNILQYLDPSTMTSLEFCADTLGMNWEEVPIKDDQLIPLLEKVQKLILEVMQSELDEELKLTILRCLKGIEQAISSYHLLGVEGLRTAMESSIGSLFVAREQYRNNPESNENSNGVFEKVIECITDLNKLITFSKGVQQIGTAVVALLAATN